MYIVLGQCMNHTNDLEILTGKVNFVTDARDDRRSVGGGVIANQPAVQQIVNIIANHYRTPVY